MMVPRPTAAGPGPLPGEPVWAGIFVVPGAGSFPAAVRHVGGASAASALLGVPPGAPIDIIGRVALDKFAGFVEELRRSRSRTVSLALVALAPDAAPGDAAFASTLLEGYGAKARLGKLGLLDAGVEGYLLAGSGAGGRCCFHCCCLCCSCFKIP